MRADCTFNSHGRQDFYGAPREKWKNVAFAFRGNRDKLSGSLFPSLFHPLSLSLSRSLSLKRTRYFRQEVDFSYPVFYKSISLKGPCTHHHQGWLIGLFRYRYQYVFQYWFCFISICLTNWPTFRYYAKRKGISRVHRSERIRFLKQPRRMEESTEE